MREAIAEEDAWDSRCRGCPVGSAEWCPDIDDLSKAAIVFSNTWDHPAHEHYRASLWEHIAPSLTPAQVRDWLRRREVIVEFHAERQAATIKRAPHGDNDPA